MPSGCKPIRIKGRTSSGALSIQSMVLSQLDVRVAEVRRQSVKPHDPTWADMLGVCIQNPPSLPRKNIEGVLGYLMKRRCKKIVKKRQQVRHELQYRNRPK